MKKRILSVALALSLALTLLPAMAGAAGDSYGPDEDGYAYTVDQREFALGTIEHDGTGLTKENVFSVTVTNTGEKPIETKVWGFGRYEVSFSTDDGVLSLEPGESGTIHFSMKIAADAPNRGDLWAQSYLTVMLLGDEQDKQSDSIVLYVTFNAVNTALLPEPTPTPNPGTSSGSQGGQTQPSGNWGDNTFVSLPSGSSGSSGGQSTPVDISASQAQSQLKLDFGSRSIDLGTIYQYEEVNAAERTVTITNNSSVEVAVGFSGGTGALSGNRDDTVYLIEPGDSRDYTFSINTRTPQKGSDTLNLLVIVEPKTVSNWITSFYQESYTAGARYHITGAYTVSYDIRSRSEAGFGYKLSESGPYNVGTLQSGTGSWAGTGNWATYEKSLTLTNTSDLPYDVSVKNQTNVDWSVKNLSSGSSWGEVGPGEKVRIDLELQRSVEDGSGKMTVTLELERDGETKEIPLVFNFGGVEKGEYYAAVDINAQLGKAEDDAGNSVGVSEYTLDTPTVPNGSDLVINLTPLNSKLGYVLYLAKAKDPARYWVLDGLEFLGSMDRYEVKNVKEDQRFQARFGEAIKAPADWARDAVGKAELLGIADDALADATRGAGYYYSDLSQYTVLDFSGPITREEFCRMACNLYEKTTGEKVDEGYKDISFSDTSGTQVRKMAYLGVIKGTGGDEFNPKGQLTREQAATIMARLAQVMGVSLPQTAATFGDNADVASWAIKEVGQMQASGIMGGTGNNQFSPKMTYSIEQSLVTLIRLYDMVKG